MTDTTTVSILDRSYRLRISDEEREHLLRAAELIESQARSYGKLYSYKDNQDLLAMVALTQITQLVKTQGTLKAKSADLERRLGAIDSGLDSLLHRTQNSL
ncbi:MAG: cell division protein ZapA [Bacteroidales bacterium]|nr:cell division protein ZapA [Bacteroidales bacterium]